MKSMTATSIATAQLASANPMCIAAMSPTSILDPDAAWKQLAARDSNARFVYGVTTTGVFCRPGCASRLPLRENVRFFHSAAKAQATGFRPCKRCSPIARSSPLEKIRGHIEAHLDRPVKLDELGRVAGLSPFTVQRLFKREMGVSPLQYQRAMRAGQLRSALKQGESVTDAIYSAGFGSSSRAYEGNQLGMTPARFAQGGRGEHIGFASARTPFGWMIVGATERGLCWLSLAGTKTEGERILRDEFPAAKLLRDPSALRARRGGARKRARARATWQSQRARRLTCAAPSSSFACGRRCARFRAAKPAATRSWRARWASPKPRALSHAPAHSIALRCWCRAIAWSAPTARSPATAGASSASSSC